MGGKGKGRIAALIALLAVAWTAKAEMTLELGPTFLSGDFSNGGALILTESLNDRWAVHMGYVSEQEVDTCERTDCHFDIRENLFAGVQRTGRFWIFNVGIGIDYFQATNRALGCRFTAGLMAGHSFTDHFSIIARHNSNAGSCTPNLGQDFIGLTWTF